jgi:3' terminal RNA ribose 2'-O-methyltransferase Hen1
MILGADVSVRALEQAARRLKLDQMHDAQRQRISLLHSPLTYRDKRLIGFDAAALVEVIEHLDPPRLAAAERNVFGSARPGTVVVTTPNAEYNVRWETLPAGQFRHPDHRFEWTREQFATWAEGVASRTGYEVRYLPVGAEDPEVGAPTQMAVFRR